MHKKGNLFFPAGFAVLPSGYNAEGEMHAHLQKGMRTIEQGILHAGMSLQFLCAVIHVKDGTFQTAAFFDQTENSGRIGPYRWRE